MAPFPHRVVTQLTAMVPLSLHCPSLTVTFKLWSPAVEHL
jgi:hypothetical protein